jgi:outer membrane protein insertion porin family/translocation and assembly module TamA
LYTYLSHNVQVNVPFYYYKPSEGDNPPLGPVWASYPALMTNWDLRDDPIHPHKGIYLGNELEVAGLGGDARDIKVQPEARVYLPVSKRVTLASRVGIGLLFAQNYGQTVESNSLTRQPPAGTTQADWIPDIQLMFMRGLFAGGSGSNRGYALREIGPHGTVPFYNYGQTTATCTGPTADPNVCALPLGGFTLWEASVELRFPLVGDLAGNLFVDAADVSARRMDFRLRPHLSAGFGFRYDTPVGPIRLDLGYRIPGLQAPADARDERKPKDGPFGVPIALSFGIGESY